MVIALPAFINIKTITIAVFLGSICYQHFRGKDRLAFRRQLFNHSAALAPINALMYLFSAVPRQAYCDRSLFKELNALKENYEIIRDEGMALLQQGYIEQKERNDDVGFNSFLKRGWSRFYIKWYHYQHPSALRHCPKTCELVKQIPYIKAAMFAYLPPHGELTKHRDPYAGSLRYHLGLATPNSDDCKIFVDGVPYSWRDGEDVIFDETYLHYAYNHTDKPRLIFFCDIERPLHTRFMRAFNYIFGKYVMSAASSPNLNNDDTGGINRFYRYIHAIKNGLTKIKRKNPPLFRLTKYTLIVASVLLVIFYL
ncbi:MAG: aspartyl/asparaginyl beta-hydroxylase domain-containing protein [Legionellales bacterium]|nr:aspartyl/asparaginyl beta-hydroxylase domain-containing protein [Legionellales bacterium]